MMKSNKRTKQLRRRARVRAVVQGTQERPRMSVSRSSREITVQLIDDTKGVTILTATTRDVRKKGSTKTETARRLGELVAERAQKAKITKAVFDRTGRKYHGRMAAVADGAREKGLTI